LGHIQQLIGQDYARLRIGIGSDFSRGQQVDYVLGKFSDEEKTTLSPVFDTSQEIIKSFVLAGVDVTMNQFNRK
jgi:PTH1 family peptidyl-tRNA hydrolase